MRRIVPRLPFGYPTDPLTGQPDRTANLGQRIVSGRLRSPLVRREAATRPPPLPPRQPLERTNVNPPTDPAPPWPQPAPAGTYATRHGQTHPGFGAVPEGEREAYLNMFDPRRRRHLTRDTVLLRSMEARYFTDGRVQGNPNSRALINNYLATEPNPGVEQFRRLGLPPRCLSVQPVTMFGHDLVDPSLNVTVATGVPQTTHSYRSPGWVTVQMRLGDFLDQGGTVFDDIGAGANALLITLPQDRSVPARIVHRAEEPADG